MTRYGENYTLDQEFMDVIVAYMNNDIREKVHFEMAPCTPEEFLKRYCELDPEFESLLKSEFSIEL